MPRYRPNRSGVLRVVDTRCGLGWQVLRSRAGRKVRSRRSLEIALRWALWGGRASPHLEAGPEPARRGIRRQHIGAELAAELFGDDGGAADVKQQARVVRLRRGFRIEAQALAEAHREQRAVQPVLEGHPYAEIGCLR
jgi:hypothetical protein